MLQKSWLTILLLVCLSFAQAFEPVNINEADAQTLAETIKGVGIKRAQAIIAYREQYGPFATVDDLTRVQGIGAKLLEDSRDKLTVTSNES